MTKEFLEIEISLANEAYRNSEQPHITDEQYDEYQELLRELDPNNPLLQEVGISISGKRKTEIPIPMFSMEKIKTIDKLNEWLKNDLYIITPKYDGLSLCVEELIRKAYTRGDGTIGQRSDEHFSTLNTNKIDKDIITYGEVIMPRDVFMEKYSQDFANGRNFVSGLLNSDDPSEPLKDCHYVRYGWHDTPYATKAETLDELNKLSSTPVPYVLIKSEEITEDLLRDLFAKWSRQYEIDGLIIEYNDIHTCDELGRERNGNPVWARAYKGEFETRKETTVTHIEYNISKRGELRPRIGVEPIELDGVTVSYVTGNNARYIKDMGIGVGSKVLMKRSGFVIPYIIKTLERKPFILPEIDVPIAWDENEVNLMCLELTDDQKIKQITAFFKIIGVEDFSEATVRLMYENGYTTIKSILDMTKDDMMTLPRFGERKAKLTYDAIHKVKEVSLSKLQHASGFFNMLGSKKLLLLEQFNENTPIDRICDIDGFAPKSAASYLNGMPLFNQWYEEEIKDHIKAVFTPVFEASSDEFEGKNFVFTGVRNKDFENYIKDKGGVIGSSVSSKTTHLVMKEKGSGSSKEQKAIKLGIEILDINEFEEKFIK